MKHVAAGISALVSVIVLASACDDGGPRHHHHRRQRGVACTVQPSCGTCTPVLGCGFCFTAGGGVCVDDPAACPRGSSGFTWEPSGCPGADAGVDVVRIPADAALVSREDASAEPDAVAPPPADDASVDAAVDGADGGPDGE